MSDMVSWWCSMLRNNIISETFWIRSWNIDSLKSILSHLSTGKCPWTTFDALRCFMAHHDTIASSCRPTLASSLANWCWFSHAQ
jgi:hypothetical protein